MLHQPFNYAGLSEKVDELLVLGLAFLEQIILVKHIFERNIGFVEKRFERRYRRKAESPLLSK